MSNLYAHGPTHQTMRADTPLDSTGKKGVVRARMWTEALAAHNAGRVKVAEVRASDFFGPQVTDANMGERVVPNVLKGSAVQLLGRTDVPHSFSYMPDVARVVAAVAQTPEAWGRAWVVPSNTLTQGEMIRALSAAAGVSAVKVKTIPRIALSAAGLFLPLMRELKEVWYQFNAPFVLDGAETEERFGIAATSIEKATAETVAWWRDRNG